MAIKSRLTPFLLNRLSAGEFHQAGTRRQPERVAGFRVPFTATMVRRV